MLRQAENRVKIEGILSEVNLENGSYEKDGRTIEYVRGNIKVLVTQVINGKPVENEIPVQMFSNRYTNAGKPNPAFESIMKVKNEFTSIAAAGGQEGADRVRITGADIRMNEYYDANGNLVSYPRINASFASKIKKDDCNPEATFTIVMVIGHQDYQYNQEGEIVKDYFGNDKYVVTGLVPQYNGRLDKINFVCSNENVINAVRDYWEVGETVKASGRINFSSTTETKKIEQGFGEPIVQNRTIVVNDLVITGGSQTPLEGEYAYDHNEIQAALAERQNRLEAEKNNPKTRTAPRPIDTNNKKAVFDGLGF